MKIFGTFHASDDPKIRGQAERSVASTTMDEVIRLLGPQVYPQSRWHKDPPYRARIHDFELSDPLIREVFQVIYKLEGRRPTPWRLLRTAHSAEYYYEPLRREYTKADLDKAPLLALFGTRWIAKMADGEKARPLRVIGNKQLVEPKPFGRIDPFVVRGMNSWLVAELQKRGVRGFTAREIEIVRRKPEHQSIWEPWSAVMMPPCRLPLVTAWGEPYTAPGRGCFQECGPYQPEEMVFLRSEVEALGDFDIAVCQEIVGNGGQDLWQPLVVSQRFRQIMTELKVPGVAYAPVWLKEPGEPLWENPWESFLGPYPETLPVA